MINFVNSLADLTAIRDREELELIMAQVAADLLGATTVRFWRVVGHSPGLRLHERARLTDRVATLSDPPVDIDELPTLDSRPELNACYYGKVPCSVAAGADGTAAAPYFPVMGAREIAGFLDVQVAAPLRDDQRSWRRAFCASIRIISKFSTMREGRTDRPAESQDLR